MRASEIRKGQAVIIDGKLLVVTGADHNTPGNLRAKVQFKLRDVIKQTIMDKRVSATEDIETATLDRRKVEYLYSDNEGHILMDTETYDQIALGTDLVGPAKNYLKDGMTVEVLMHDDEPLGIELPPSVELRVTYTEPGVKGDTATGGTKPATVETGMTVQVPLFVKTDDVIRVDTRTDSYLERV